MTVVGPVKPVKMTEAEIAEQCRVAWDMAGYAKRNLPLDEFKAVFAELHALTRWQRERKENDTRRI